MDSPPEPQPPETARSNPLILLGVAAAVAAGLGIAGALILNGQGAKAPPPPASQGGLVIEAGEAPGRIDPAKPLRCFVAGRFVGELSLNECATRNGVATDALDVGVDETGALAAAQDAGPEIIPLPPPEAEPAADAALPEVVTPDAAPTPQAAAAGSCWRYNRGRWTKVAGDMDLNACVQFLFAGRCERAGAADYGRWGQQTLRLVTGRVEASGDNQSFRTLATQAPNCVIPPLG